MKEKEGHVQDNYTIFKCVNKLGGGDIHTPLEEVDVCCLSHEPSSAEERDYLSACDTHKERRS